MRFLPIAVALILAGSLAAQDKPTLAAEYANPQAAAPISVTIVALSKKGELLPTLSESDFTLKADKKPQTITSFEPIGSKPTVFGLLFDTAHSSPETLDDERDATAIFLNKNLTSGNKAFVVQFAAQVQLAADVTDQTAALQAGLKSLKTTPPLPMTAVSMPDNSGTGNDNKGLRTGPTLYDAVFLSADEVLKKYPLRRVLIIFSDGIDRNSKETLEVALEAAQRANAVVYGIYVDADAHRDRQQDRRTAGNSTPGGRNSNCSPRSGYPGGGGGYPGGGGGYPGGGGGYPGGGGGYPGSYPQSPGTNNCPTSQGPTGADHKPFVDGHAVLDRIAGETGGRTFDISRKHSLDQIFEEIAADLHAQYQLTFTPKDLDTTRDHYHQIDLDPVPTFAKQKPNLLFRDGFYTGDPVRY